MTPSPFSSAVASLLPFTPSIAPFLPYPDLLPSITHPRPRCVLHYPRITCMLLPPPLSFLRPLDSSARVTWAAPIPPCGPLTSPAVHLFHFPYRPFSALGSRHTPHSLSLFTLPFPSVRAPPLRSPRPPSPHTLPILLDITRPKLACYPVDLCTPLFLPLDSPRRFPLPLSSRSLLRARLRRPFDQMYILYYFFLVDAGIRLVIHNDIFFFFSFLILGMRVIRTRPPSSSSVRCKWGGYEKGVNEEIE
ncbi:hypothetical protein DFH09DRAFT_527998 [Mycena vulgaris]|nr:hypothetical protein DFH09DRAFT_527998 [Mycena vulgaris]